MDAGTWVAIAAALIAAGALVFNFQSARAARLAADAAIRAAKAAEEQTSIQGQLRVEAAQPFVWVDVRPGDDGTVLELVVGNSGPTVARNVRIQVEPPLAASDGLEERTEAAQARLSDGVSSLAPGRTLAWPLGASFNLIGKDGPTIHTFTVLADGPFGPMSPLTHRLDVDDLRGTRRQPSPLYRLSTAIEELHAR